MSKTSLMAGKSIGRQLCALQTKVVENGACMVCLAQNPAYICMGFKTFVCESCADVHREFGFKVSSIMHSEWSAEDYTAIESKGGNKRAATEFLAFYNPDDFPRPAATDTENVKAFIRKAFVVKCWQRQPKAHRARRSSASRNIFPVGEDGGAHCPPSFPVDDMNWAHFPPVDEVGPFDPSAPPAGGPGPWPAPESFVPLPMIEAYFCSDHDSSEKRPKGEASVKACRGCSISLNTNYVSLVYCPTCSNQRSACLICGQPGARGIAGAQKPEQAPKSFSREGSESTDAPATSVGNLDGESRLKTDFSSDGESLLDTPSGGAGSGGGGGASAAAGVAAAPLQPAAPGLPPGGSLLDLDLEEEDDTEVPEEPKVDGPASPGPLLPESKALSPGAAVAALDARGRPSKDVDVEAADDAFAAPPAEAACAAPGAELFAADFTCSAATAAATAAMALHAVQAPSAEAASPHVAGDAAGPLPSDPVAMAEGLSLSAHDGAAAVPAALAAGAADDSSAAAAAESRDGVRDLCSVELLAPSSADEARGAGAGEGAAAAEAAVAEVAEAAGDEGDRGTPEGAAGAAAVAMAESAAAPASLEDEAAAAVPEAAPASPEGHEEVAEVAPVAAAAVEAEAAASSSSAWGAVLGMGEPPPRTWDDPFKDCDVPEEPPPPSTPPTAAGEAAAALLAAQAPDADAAEVAETAPAMPAEASVPPLEAPGVEAEAEEAARGTPVHESQAPPPEAAEVAGEATTAPEVAGEATEPEVAAAVAAAAAPPPPSAAEAGLRLCEEVLRGNTDALLGLFNPMAKPPLEEGPPSPDADPWSAFDALRPRPAPAPCGVAYPHSQHQVPQLRAAAGHSLPSAPALAGGGMVGGAPAAPSMPRAAAAPPLSASTPAMASVRPFPPTSSSFMPDEWIQSGDSSSAFSDVLDAFHKKETSWEAKPALQSRGATSAVGGVGAVAGAGVAARPPGQP